MTQLFNRLKLWHLTLLACSIFMGLTSGLMQWITTNNETQYHKTSIEKNSEEVAAIVVASTLDALISEDTPLLNTTINQVIEENPDIYSITVSNEVGTILSNRTQSVRDVIEPYKVSKDVIFEQEKFGTVEILFNFHNVNQAIQKHVIGVQWLLFSLMLLGSSLLFIAINQFILKPMRQTKICVSNMAQGDYTTRLSLNGSQELAELSVYLNNLSKTLEEKQTNETNFRHRLEHEVEKRTDELSNLYQQVKHQSQHDPLTGLPNRTLFFETIEQHIAGNTHHLALMFIDLDKFKNVNDSLGHDAGDQLLQEVARRLQNATRKEDTVSRFGGDEFMLLLTNVNTLDDAAAVARKVIASLSQPHRFGSSIVTCSPSIGISLYPDDAYTAIDLFKHADTAMYISKEKANGQYMFYHELATSDITHTEKNAGS